MKKKQLNLFLLSCLIYSNSSISALTAITAKTIQGTPPEIRDMMGNVPDNINDLISVELPDGSVYFGNDNHPTPTDDYPKIFVDKSLKFSDFKIDLKKEQYYSRNGDKISPSNSFTYNLTVNWKDKYGAKQTNTGDFLDSCKTPYELNITMNNAQAHSEYGDPSSGIPVDLTKKFYIYVNEFDRICGIKPLNMTWFQPNKDSSYVGEHTGPTPNPSPDPIYGGGFDINQFDPILGFNKDSGFPKTAFLNAAFSIVLPEPQTDYNITVSDSSVLSLTPSTSIDSYHTKDNRLTFKGKPTKTINITISHKYSSALSTYSFNVQNYGEPAWGEYIDQFISTKCPLFDKSILSNSPQASNTFDNNSPNQTYYNAATRAVGTFVGEWGRMDLYPNSGIGWGYHWSSQQYDYSNQWTINLSNGSAYAGKFSEGFPYFCKW